jgi:hypothetical protein
VAAAVAVVLTIAAQQVVLAQVLVTTVRAVVVAAELQLAVMEVMAHRA